MRCGWGAPDPAWKVLEGFLGEGPSELRPGRIRSEAGKHHRGFSPRPSVPQLLYKPSPCWAWLGTHKDHATPALVPVLTHVWPREVYTSTVESALREAADTTKEKEGRMLEKAQSWGGLGSRHLGRDWEGVRDQP